MHLAHVRGPGLFRFFPRREHIVAFTLHLLDAVGNVHRVLFNGGRQIGEGRLGAGDHEHIGEVGHAHAHDRFRAVRPFLAQGLPAGAADGEGLQRAGVGAKAGRQHDDIEGVFRGAGAQALWRNLDDRLAAIADVHHVHIVAIEAFQIAVIERRPLGKQRVVAGFGDENIGGAGVLDALAHFVGDESGGHQVGFGAGQQVVEGFEHPAKTARPFFFEDTLYFLRRCVHGHAPVGAVKGHAEDVIAALGNDLIVVRLDLLLPLGGHRRLHRGQNEIGRAVEHGHALGLVAHGRHHLHRGGARANDADAFAGPVQVLGPARRMEQGALEALHTLDVGNHRLRDHAHGAD